METLHLIGNAHLDPVWFWPWQEGYQEVKATFLSALDRMEENEHFIFLRLRRLLPLGRGK